MTARHPIARAKIKSVRLKPEYGWVIKHRGATHRTRLSFYETKADAEKDFATIPQSGIGDSRGKKYCQGCGVGCADEYEIVKVRISQATNNRK